MTLPGQTVCTADLKLLNLKFLRLYLPREGIVKDQVKNKDNVSQSVMGGDGDDDESKMRWIHD
jgi:hypothetical protein